MGALRLPANLAIVVAVYRGLGAAHASEPAPEGAALEWTVDADAFAGCASAREIAERVEASLHRQAFAPEGAVSPWAPVVQVRIEGPDATGRHRAWVSLRLPDDPAGASTAARDGTAREIVAPSRDCRSLDEPLALVIALMLDAEQSSESERAAEAARRSAAPAETEVDPEPPPEREPIVTAPAVSTRRSAGWNFDLGVAALGATGLLPAPSPGAELAASVSPPLPLDVRMHAAAFLPQTESLGSGASVSFFFAQGGVDACTRTDPTSSVRLRPCLGASVGWLGVHPSGLEQSQRVTQVIVVGEGGLVAAFRVGKHWMATASVLALVPFDAHRFAFRRADGRLEPVFRQAPVAAVVGLGAAFAIE